MPSDTPPPGIDPARHAQRLPRRIHRLRMLGMGLAALPIGMVLLENQAGAGHYPGSAPETRAVTVMARAGPAKASRAAISS